MLMACTNKKQTTNNDMEQELTLTQEWEFFKTNLQ